MVGDEDTLGFRMLGRTHLALVEAGRQSAHVHCQVVFVLYKCARNERGVKKATFVVLWNSGGATCRTPCCALAVEAVLRSLISSRVNAV